MLGLMVGFYVCVLRIYVKRFLQAIMLTGKAQKYEMCSSNLYHYNPCFYCKTKQYENLPDHT